MHLLIYEFLLKNKIETIIDKQQDPKIILLQKFHLDKEQTQLAY